MADDAAKLQIVLEALVGEFKASLQQAVGAVQKSTQQMQGQVKDSTRQMENSFKSMGSNITGSMKDMHGQVTGAISGIGATIGKLAGIMAGVAAVLAGGALFKKAIDSYSEYIGEAKKLSAVTGQNINDAAAMNYAFKRVGVGSDEVLNAFRGLNRQMRTNEESIEAMGVKTRDTEGNFRSAKDVFFEALAVIKQYPEGFDRSQAAMALFGTRLTDVSKFLKANSDGVERASEFLRGLGMTIGPEMEAQLRKFKAGLVDSNTVFTAISFQIAGAVIPRLTQLGNWFAGEGKTAVAGFVGALEILGNVLYGIGKAAQFALSAASMAAAVHGGEVSGGLVRGGLTIPPPKLSSSPPETPSKRWTAPGDDTKGGGGGKGENRLEALILQLNQQLAQLGEGSLAGIQAWAEKVASEINKVEGAAELKTEALTKLSEVQKSKEKKLEDDFTKWYSGAMHDRLAQVEAKYQDELKKVKGIKDAEIKLEQWKAGEIKKVNSEMQLEGMNLLKGQLDALAGAVPLLSQQLPIKARLLELEIQIANATLLKELADKPHLAHLKDELLSMQALAAQAKRYQLEMSRWETQGIGGGVKMLQMEMVKESGTQTAKDFVAGFKKAQDFAGDALSGFLKGALRGEKADLRKLGMSIADMFIDGMVKVFARTMFSSIFGIMASAWEGTQATMTAASAAGESARLGITASGASQGMGILASLAKGTILIQAGQAAAGAFKSVMVSVPFPFNVVLAPIVAAAAFAATMAFGSGFGSGGGGSAGTTNPSGGYSEGYHSGGIITAHGGLRLDERMIKAQVGEWVLNRDAAQALQRAGGPSTFDNLNSGILPVSADGRGGPQVNQVINMGGQNISVRDLNMRVWRKFQRKAVRSMKKDFQKIAVMG